MTQDIFTKILNESIDKGQTKKSLEKKVNHFLNKQRQKNQLKLNIEFIIKLFLCLVLPFLIINYVLKINFDVNYNEQIVLFFILSLNFYLNFIFIQQILFTNNNKAYDYISIFLLASILLFSILNIVFILYKVSLINFIIFDIFLLFFISYPLYYIDKQYSINNLFQFYFYNRKSILISIEDRFSFFQSFLTLKTYDFKVNEQQLYLKMFCNTIMYNKKKNKYYISLNFLLAS